jgi:hypothetical protein
MSPTPTIAQNAAPLESLREPSEQLHPAEALGLSFGGDVHCPAASHGLGEPQLPSASHVFGEPQLPSASHVLGEPQLPSASHVLEEPQPPSDVHAVAHAPASSQLDDTLFEQVPPVHWKPATQSPSALQEELQVVLSAAHKRLPGQSAGAPATQTPLPSQVLAVSVPPVHVEPQAPVGYVHALWFFPSQLPPQVPLPEQAGRAPCGAPVTAEQVPGPPGLSHASHAPEQA